MVNIEGLHTDHLRQYDPDYKILPGDIFHIEIAGESTTVEDPVLRDGDIVSAKKLILLSKWKAKG